MAFNFAEIKQLGTIYRCLQEAINRYPSQPIQKTADIIGAQLLRKADVSAIQGHRITISCQLRTFPAPKYSIGEYVEFYLPQHLEIDMEAKERGIITGMSFHQEQKEVQGWWYDIILDQPTEKETISQKLIIGRAPIWESPDFEHINEETQMLLDSFLDNFERNHGPLLPPLSQNREVA